MVHILQPATAKYVNKIKGGGGVKGKDLKEIQSCTVITFRLNF